MGRKRKDEETIDRKSAAAGERAEESHGPAEYVFDGPFDELFVTFLTTKLGITPAEASRALLDFRELRQGSRETVRPH